MNGVHDMGGLENLGPLVPDTLAPAFHAAWQARAFAMVLASPSSGNIDAGRHARERIPGAEYLAMSYFERWFAGLCIELLEADLVTTTELATGRPAPSAALSTPRLSPEHVKPIFTRAGSFIRERAEPPQFAAGTQVRARDLNPHGHTRLPRYVRGRIGVVEQWHGAHVFPDSHAHGLGEDPQHLYGVRFAAQALWGAEADPRSSVRLDIWEPCLESI